MGRFIYFQPNHEIFRKFDNYEIWPCTIVGKNEAGEIIYEVCDADFPDISIWCVYGHFFIGGLECISDHFTLEDAYKFMKSLPLFPVKFSEKTL